MLDCARMQAALSARLDGEPSGIDDDVLDAHVSMCEQCHAFVEGAARLNRHLAVSMVPEVPVDSERLQQVVLSGVDVAGVGRRGAVLLVFARVALVVVAVGYVAWALRLLGDSATSVAVEQGIARLVSDAAAVRLALAFGLVWCAWRPRAVGSVLPVFGALFMFSSGFAARDVMVGQASSGQLWGLVMLCASVVVMVVVWLSDRGWAEIVHTWKSLQSNPA